MNQEQVGTSATLGLEEPTSSAASVRLRPNKLGVVAIAFFAIAAAAPMAAVVGASPVLFSASGAGTPVIYVIAALLVALFSVGYLRMSHHINNAGGFVAYMAKGLGNKWATGGAGIAILTYLSLQIGLWSQFGVFAQMLLEGLTGVSLPVYLWIAVLLAVVTGLTMRGVDASLKVLGVLIIGEAFAVAALVVSLVAQKGLGIFTLKVSPGPAFSAPAWVSPCSSPSPASPASKQQLSSPKRQRTPGEPSPVPPIS